MLSDLIPIAASADQPYIKTVVQAYIPTSDVSELQLQIRNANSAFYQQQNASAAALMAMIDNTWPIYGQSGTSTSDADGSGTTTSSAADKSDEADSVGNSASNSSPVRGISVGIATGVVAGACLYGTAMFFVAKRYRKKRASHQRASSVLSGQQAMSQVDGATPATALMSGAHSDGYRSTTPGGRNSRGSGRDGSGRTQYISTPVAAENSLGWN